MRINKSYLYIVLVACLTFTVLPGWIPQLRITWLILSITFLFSLVQSFGYYKLRYLIAWYIYFLVVLFNSLLGDAYYVSLLGAAIELYKWIIPPAILFYSMSKGDYRFSKAFLYSIFFIILFEGVSSFFLDLSNPGIIRNAVMEFIANTDRSVYYPYYRMGMASYSFSQSIAILIPPLAFVIKDETKQSSIRIVYTILLVVCLVLVYLSGSTTALILGTAAVLFSLFSSKGSASKNRRVIIIVSLIVLPFVFSETLLFGLLNTLDGLLDETYFSSKIEDFLDLASIGEASGDIRARKVLYLQSIEQWIQHPLLGTNELPGYHSAFLDRLAALGLLGFVPLIVFIYYQVKYTVRRISNGARIFYYEGFFIGILLLFLKDSDDWETFLMLFLVLPLIIWINDGNAFGKRIVSHP